MHTPFKTSHGAERVRGRAHEVIDGVSDRVVPLIDRLSRRSHALVERTAIGASDAADALMRGRKRLGKMRRSAVVSSRDFIRDHPFAAVAAAAVVGALIYGLWRARRD